MSSWGDEIEAAVNPGVRDPLLPGDVDLLLQELLILLIDVLEDGLPAGGNRMFQNKRDGPLQILSMISLTYQLSLLIWSPKPGVSITVSFIFTPPSSSTAKRETTSDNH